MSIRKPYSLLVCLAFLLMWPVADAGAYSVLSASAAAPGYGLYAPAVSVTKDVDPNDLILPKRAAQPKDLELFSRATTAPAVPGAGGSKPVTKTRPIMKVRPLYGDPGTYGTHGGLFADPLGRFLPQSRVRGWEFDAEVLFARAKGHVRFMRGTSAYYYYPYYIYQSDLNSVFNLPDHTVMWGVSLAYRFRPNWAMRYSIMPMDMSGSGPVLQTVAFGNRAYSLGQSTKARWERVYQRAGLVYDTIRTRSSRLSVFGDYVRLEEKVSLTDPTYGTDIMNHDLNMAMAGLEFEKSLKTGRYCNTLSLEGKAGIAFLDEAVGSDASAGLKYSIPLGAGRWGYLAGGYRYLTYRKNYSDVFQVDTAIEGGYLKMGFMF